MFNVSSLRFKWKLKTGNEILFCKIIFLSRFLVFFNSADSNQGWASSRFQLGMGIQQIPTRDRHPADSSQGWASSRYNQGLAPADSNSGWGSSRFQLGMGIQQNPIRDGHQQIPTRDGHSADSNQGWASSRFQLGMGIQQIPTRDGHPADSNLG